MLEGVDEEVRESQGREMNETLRYDLLETRYDFEKAEQKDPGLFSSWVRIICCE